jgi:hypothetical protein
MAIDKSTALAASFSEGLIQLAEEIPGLSSLIESIRTYHENIENQQREAFSAELATRIDALEKHAAWYKTLTGEQFMKKVVATALNAEYCDKLEFLANALVNGPSLRDDDARRAKFVELIRQMSRPALEVLVASVRLTHDGDIIVDRIAEHLEWHPAVVDSCVRELHSLGAYSHNLRWEKRNGRYQVMASFMDTIPGVATLTQEFARFLQNPSKVLGE